MTLNVIELFDAHLNASWLRPENVVWDTVASSVIRGQAFTRPTLDLGSGNGIFSFLTAGGRFEAEFDWFLQAEPERVAGPADLYDVSPRVLAPAIRRAPDYRIDVALDHKRGLLEQAAVLDLYERTVEHDAAEPLPFADGAFATVFSNILYWLDEPQRVLKECARVLAPGGRAVFCVPDPAFYTLCESYRWRETGSEWLRLLNGGRDGCMHWTATQETFERWAADAGLRVIRHHSYLHQRTLALWDTGLRPLSRPLIALVNNLPDQRRAAVKQEWMAAVRPLLLALLEEEGRATGCGGFHCFVASKPA